MSTFTLKRSGNSDLVVAGKLLGESTLGSVHKGDRRKRWVELAVYETESGKFVAARTFRTTWEGESDRFEVQVCESAGAAVQFLREWSPRELAIGYPEGKQFAERQERLINELRTIHDDRLSELAAKLNVQEHVQ